MQTIGMMSSVVCRDELDDKTPPAAYEAGRRASCISLKPTSVDERLDKVERKWRQAVSCRYLIPHQLDIKADIVPKPWIC